MMVSTPAEGNEKDKYKKNKIRFSTNTGRHFVVTSTVVGWVNRRMTSLLISSPLTGRFVLWLSKMVDVFQDEQTFYFAFFTFTLTTIVAAFIISRFLTLNPSYHS